MQVSPLSWEVGDDGRNTVPSRKEQWMGLFSFRALQPLLYCITVGHPISYQTSYKRDELYWILFSEQVHASTLREASVLLKAWQRDRASSSLDEDSQPCGQLGQPYSGVSAFPQALQLGFWFAPSQVCRIKEVLKWRKDTGAQIISLFFRLLYLAEGSWRSLRALLYRVWIYMGEIVKGCNGLWPGRLEQ